MGGMLVSAEIVQFIPRPRHDSEQTDFPVIVFRSVLPDLASDHAGPAIRENARPASVRDPTPLNNEDRTFSSE
jgi:hypothetical protein